MTCLSLPKLFCAVTLIVPRLTTCRPLWIGKRFKLHWMQLVPNAFESDGMAVAAVIDGGVAAELGDQVGVEQVVLQVGAGAPADAEAAAVSGVIASGGNEPVGEVASYRGGQRGRPGDHSQGPDGVVAAQQQCGRRLQSPGHRADHPLGRGA